MRTSSSSIFTCRSSSPSLRSSERLDASGSERGDLGKAQLARLSNFDRQEGAKQTVGASRLARRSISNGWWGEYSFDLSAALHMALLSQHVLPGRHALRIALQSSKVASSKARFSTESSVANTSQRWWTPFCSLSRSRETRKQLRSRQLSHNHPDFLGLPASKVHQPRVLRLESSEWP